MDTYVKTWRYTNVAVIVVVVVVVVVIIIIMAVTPWSMTGSFDCG